MRLALAITLGTSAAFLALSTIAFAIREIAVRVPLPIRLSWRVRA